MENLETIAGIPAEILAKSFPEVNQSLFKSIFRNDPIVELVRIEPGPTFVKIEPEVDQSDDIQEPSEILVNLGEVQISDLKLKVETLEENEVDIEERLDDAYWKTSEELIETTRPNATGSEDQDSANSSNISEIGIDNDSKLKPSLPKKKPSNTRKPDPRVQCDICNKSISIYYLKIHKLTHIKDRDEESPFKCSAPGCSKTFLYISGLKEHKQNNHTPENERGDFRCPKCKKKMTNAKYKNYKRHTSKCNPDQMCEFCPKIFRSRHEFVRHRNTHTKEKEYKCQECDAIFYRSSGLLSHRKLHLKERPFPCTVKGCSKSMITRTELNRHIKDYHIVNEEGFQCPHCPQKYRIRAPLIGHINRVHKKEKNCSFKCDVDGCGGIFNAEEILRKHKETRHGTSKHYLCSKCGRSFKNFIRLSTHEVKYCVKR